MSESDADLLRTLDEVIDPRESPVATPGDVADELPIGAEAVRQRLIRLAADDDGIMTRKVGRSRVFWTWTAVGSVDQEESDDGDRPDRERADHGGGTTDDFDPNADVDELLQEESDDDLRVLADVETPPQPTREEFEEAALAAVEYLREEGGATKSDFQKSIHDDYTARYENQRTWWRKVVKPALKAHPDIETPPKGASTWRFRE